MSNIKWMDEEEEQGYRKIENAMVIKMATNSQERK